MHCKILKLWDDMKHAQFLIQKKKKSKELYLPVYNQKLS